MLAALAYLFAAFGDDEGEEGLTAAIRSENELGVGTQARRSEERTTSPGKTLAAPSPELDRSTSPGPDVSLSGRVVDALGRPVAGASLLVEFERHPSLSPEGGLPSPLEGGTDREGRFSLTRLPVGWRFRLAVTATGFATLTRRGFLEAGGLDLGDLLLPRGVILAGRVRDTEGRPASGVVVEARRPSGARMAPTMSGALMSVRSDERGAFLFAGLPPESSFVVAARKGAGAFAVLTVDGLTAGDRRDGLDLVLPPSRSLQGRVVDQDGSPLSGAVILTAGALGSVSGAWSKTYGRVEVRTNAEGRFVLGDLPRSRIDLRVRAPGHLERLVLVGKDETTVEVRLEASPLVFGRITGPDGRGLSPFSLRVLGGLDESRALGRVVLGDAARSLAGVEKGEGYFAILDLSSRRGALEVSAPGFAKTVRTLPLDLAAGERRRMDIVLEREVECRGVVVDARTGEPVGGALVLVDQERSELLQTHMTHHRSQAEGASGDSVPRGVHTNAEGAFSLKGLPKGRHVVMAVHPDYLSSPSVPFLLQGTKDDLRLLLDPAASVEGVVRDASGEPVAGAQVALFRDFSDDPTGGSQRVFRGGFGQERLRTHADAQGRFRLAGLQEGLYRVRVRGPGAPELQQWLVAGIGLGQNKASGRRLRIGRGEALRIDLTLDVLAGVEGVVLRGGRPVPGAVIVVRSGDDPLVTELPRTVADRSGRFRVDSLPPGRALLEVAGQPPQLFPVQLIGGETVFRSLELPSGVIAGVVQVDGRPKAGVAVVLEDLGKAPGKDPRGLVKAIRGMDIAETEPAGVPSSPGSGHRTGPKGGFRFEGLKPGRYRIRAKGASAVEVELAAGEERTGLVLTVTR